MAWRKTLIFGVFIVIYLLGSYILSVKQNRNQSQNTPQPLGHIALRNETPGRRSSSQNTEAPQLGLNGHDEPAVALVRTGAPPTPTPTTPRPPGAASSTESPFFGDSYMREEVAAPTKCADSFRSRVSKTEFGARYLRDVPTLQRADHATRGNYRRLSKYGGCHGWGGVDYQTLADALAVLNATANGQLLDDWRERGGGAECTRCAVVGNGGILKGSGQGQEIDQHHYVFRTNGAITRGFEQDVGSRTTHYTFSTNTLMNSMNAYASSGFRGPPVSKETRYVFLPSDRRDYLFMKAAATHVPVGSGRDKGKDPSKYLGADVSAEKLKMYHPDFVRYLRNRFLRSEILNTRHKDIYRVTTGGMMLLAALHTCDQVSAYGFITPDFGNYSDHYFDRVFHPVGFYVNHDMRMEMKLWQQLHQSGLLRLYQRQGEQ